MTRARRLLSTVAVLAAVLVPAARPQPATAQTSSWQLTVLRPLVEGHGTKVHDLNASGVAAGSSGSLPVLWTAAGQPVPLPIPAGFTGGEALAINDRGEVAGILYSEPGPTGVLWTQAGTTTFGHRHYPTDVNEHGVVAGLTYAADETTDGFVRLPDGQLHTLPDAGLRTVIPQALNDWGFVVGDAHDPDQLLVSKGVGWLGPALFPLDDDPHRFLEAVDVVNTGHVLVRLIPGAISFRSGFVSPGQPGITLLPGALYATDVNELGIVVGTVGAPGQQNSWDPIPPGFLHVYGTTVLLEDLVDRPAEATPDLGSPVALNDRAWIVGQTGKRNTSVSWLLRPPG